MNVHCSIIFSYQFNLNFDFRVVIKIKLLDSDGLDMGYFGNEFVKDANGILCFKVKYLVM